MGLPRPKRLWLKDSFRVGAFSRAKGGREERALVQHLKKLGYEDAVRVPLSGAAKGFKFDVLGSWKGVQESFELKTRHSGFNWFYKFLERTGLNRFCFDGVCVAISTNPADLKVSGFDNPFHRCDEDHPEKVVLRRIVKLRELKKGADYLVVRSNMKPRLFLKYWV